MSRIVKEYKKIKKVLESHGEAFENLIVQLAPVNEYDLLSWKATIRGPSDTPYNGFSIGLTIKIPSDYPISPPMVKFEPYKMPHCNVNFQTGEICLDILTRQHWSPAWDLLHVLKAIEQLLQEPVPESPLNVDIANILKEGDRTAYTGLVRYYFCGGT